jgi:hypothetical protein
MILPRWLPWLLCFIVAFAMTGPVWLAEEPSLVGNWEALDLAGSVWAHWWTSHAIFQGENPFVGSASYFPIGLDPVLQYNLLDAMINAPWVWLAGPRAGYNIATIVALTTTGVGGYALARSSGSQQSGALLCAIIIESSSAVALELYSGRISQVMLVFFLLSLAGLIRIIRHAPSMALAISLGIAAAATALVYWYFGFALLLAGSVILWNDRQSITRKHLSLLSVSVLVGLALTVPFVVDLVQQWDGLPGVQRSDAHLGAMAVESGKDIAIKNSRWLLWPFINNSDLHGHQLGLVTVGLTFAAIRWKVAGIKPWLAVAAIGWILALGPVLQGYSSITTISLPYGWLQSVVPTFDRMWWPYRFDILTVIGFSVAAAHGLDRFLQQRNKAGLWLSAALVLTMIDAPIRSGLIPVSVSAAPASNPSLYENLDGPLLTTPVQPTTNIANHLLWAQTIHGLPTQNGDGEQMLGHRPQGYTEWLESNAMLEALTTLHRQGTVNTTIHPPAVAALKAAGFRYVVVDHTVYPEGRGHHWAAAHGQFFTQLWGPSLRSINGGAVWKIETIDGPREISAAVGKGRGRRLR